MSTILLIFMRRMIHVKSTKSGDQVNSECQKNAQMVNQVNCQLSQRSTNEKPSELPNISTHCHMYMSFKKRKTLV